MADISQATQKLISRYKDWYRSLQPKEGIPTVHVDEVASKVAMFYERMRGVIDWREEHLLRRSSIERILKRRLFLKQEGKDLAAPFVQELIRGGYFPNDRIEEEKIGLVQRMIEKYVFIFQNSGTPSAQKGKIQLYDWLISVAACETEEILDPPRRERAIIDYMEELMEQRIAAPEGISNEEKSTQVSIAVQKSLFKLDKAIIAYHLLKKRFSRWRELSGAELENIAKNIYSLWNNLEKNFKHPLSEKFYRICEKHDTPYLILGDILSEDPPKTEEKMDKPELLEIVIAEVYYKRLRKLKSRIRRAAFYSTVSIFFTKILLALAVEIPFDKYFTKQISYETVGLSVFIPSFLMFLLVSTIRSPGKSNLQKVVMETMKIVYHSDKNEVYLIKSPKKRGVVLNIILTLLYSATFALSLGVIWFGLSSLNFGLLSKIIFLIFFSLISFAGVKLRERAKELTIEEEKGGFISFFLDSFSLPFITMGKWLSSQWTKYNIVIVLITALIDLPLQFFTEFLEQWRNFLKEKKEEIH